MAQEGLMNNVDYIYWTENDMLNPFDCITKLYENKKDICSGLYFLRLQVREQIFTEKLFIIR